MLRSDSHRIAVLDPADYALVAFEDMHEDEGMIEVLNLDGIDGIDRDSTPRRFLPGGGVEYTGPAYRYTEGDLFAALMERVENPNYGCRLCGQAHGNRYWYYFQHTPTGDVIRVGSKCAAACHLASREELENRRAHERRDMAVERGHRLYGDPAAQWAIEWCWRNVGEVEATSTGGLRLIMADNETQVPFARRFASDVLKRFNREAQLTDKQVALCRKLDGEEAQRKKQAERIEQEKAEATPIPSDLLEGRAAISGEVVSLKWKDSAYGGSWKVIVCDDRGFKVWGTATDSMLEVMFLQAGDGFQASAESQAAFIAHRIRHHEAKVRVAFIAAVTGSDDDPAFGFFKRPTKVSK